MQETLRETTEELRPVLVPSTRPVKPRRGLLWLVLTGVTICAALGLLYRDEIEARLGPPPPSVRTTQVQPGTVEQTIRLTGRTIARTAVYLRAPNLRGRRSNRAGDFGLVLEKLAAPGTFVTRGAPVAMFDRLYMMNRLDDYRADRVELEHRLETLKADVEVRRNAHRQLVRAAKARMDQAALDLKTSPVRSAIQVALFQHAYEEAKANHEALLAQTKDVEASAQADIRIAELALREAQVEERRAQTNAEKMLVRAPVDGLVVISEIFRGSEFGAIKSGDQVRPGQPYAQIADPGSLMIEAIVNQVDVEQMRLGAAAHLRFDAYADLELPARVNAVSPLAKPRRWRGNYVSEVPVFLKLERSDPRLIPNLTVSADVVLASEQSEEIVPREAVFSEPDGEQPVAYVRTESGWEKRELQLGLASEVAVVVRSGLSRGELVALDEPVG